MPRVEGVAKVTGAAPATPTTSACPASSTRRVLRSPHPHARITRIDTSKAEALPGVHAVLSARERARDRLVSRTRASCSTDTVRFVGDEVAAVAAESEEIAEDALRLIEVEYEPLPFVHRHGGCAGARRARDPRRAATSRGEPRIYARGDVAGRVPRRPT